MIISLRTLAVAAALVASASAHAQSTPPAPMKVRGVIAKASAHALTLTQTDDGKPVTIALPDKVAIRLVSKARLADIKPDSFIGTAATERPDGTLKALEVHIFAASLRGSGEGFRPWQGAGGATGTMTNGTVGTMTNGTVGSMVNGTVGGAHGGHGGSRTLVVTYKGGQQTVVVTPDVPVVYMAPGTHGVLKRGAHVLVIANPDQNGALTAMSVIAGKGGVVPPM